jgi:hypothetical protein
MISQDTLRDILTRRQEADRLTPAERQQLAALAYCLALFAALVLQAIHTH